MVDVNRTSVEFEGSLDETGKITIPNHLIGDLKRNAGAMHVRLTSKALSSELQRHRVSEEEIERMCNMQRESREQIIKFLLSEGALGKRPGRRRVH